jgi:hypothetical protein
MTMQLDAVASLPVGLGDAADTAVDDGDLDLVGGQVGERLDESLDGALHVRP